MSASPSSPIYPNALVTLHYLLSSNDVSLINTFGGNPATLTLGSGTLSPNVEACLLGLSAGDKKVFHLEKGKAFGELNPALFQWVTHSMLRELGETGSGYQIGEIVQFPTPDGQGTFSGIVVKLAQDGDTSRPDGAAFQVDFNHPLAGQSVTFEVEIIGVI